MANTTKNKSSKCVMARLMREGQAYQANFGLREYKTWKAAEEAAQKWVKKMKKKLPPPSDSYGKKSRRNRSGIVGVWPRIKNFKSSVGETDYCRWYSRWPGCPLVGGVSFSAEKHGDDEAFALAFLARENETVDRKWLEKRMKTFQKTKKYKDLIAQKELEFVDIGKKKRG